MKGCKYCNNTGQIHFDEDWNVEQTNETLLVWNYTNQIASIRIPINFCLHCGRRLRKPKEYEWGKCEVTK